MTRQRSLELIMRYATGLCVVEDLGASGLVYNEAYSNLKKAVIRHHKRFAECGQEKPLWGLAKEK